MRGLVSCLSAESTILQNWPGQCFPNNDLQTKSSDQRLSLTSAKRIFQTLYRFCFVNRLAIYIHRVDHCSD